LDSLFPLGAFPSPQVILDFINYQVALQQFWPGKIAYGKTIASTGSAINHPNKAIPTGGISSDFYW
jgi:hypothetical protein